MRRPKRPSDAFEFMAKDRWRRLEAVILPTQLRASTSEGDMINSSYIFALSEPEFVKRQLRRAFCGGECEWRTSFWRRPAACGCG